MATRKPPNAGKGRPKGSVNKTTALLKDAILKAATEAGHDISARAAETDEEGAGEPKEDGLVAYLKKQAEANPGPFIGLLGKVLPMQVNADIGVQDSLAKLLADVATNGKRLVDSDKP